MFTLQESIANRICKLLVLKNSHSKTNEVISAIISGQP